MKFPKKFLLLGRQNSSTGVQKRHRIFIAINLPADIKKHLAKFEQRFSDLSRSRSDTGSSYEFDDSNSSGTALFKWTPEENIHITMVFLGDLTDIELGEVCVATRDIAAKHATLDINLNKVGYEIPFDEAQGKPPKMLWASGEKSAELSALKKDLEEALLEKVHFVPEKRGFAPHVTMARISAFAWRAINPEERPNVDEAIDLLFTAESIDVMESEAGRGGPHYTIIESIQLQ